MTIGFEESVRKLQWRRFQEAYKQYESRVCANDDHAKLGRFYARLKLATRLEPIQARGYSEGTLRGYTAGLRLLLAYNAAELLGEATACKVNQWEIICPRLALGLRRVLRRASVDGSSAFSNANLKKN